MQKPTNQRSSLVVTAITVTLAITGAGAYFNSSQPSVGSPDTGEAVAALGTLDTGESAKVTDSIPRRGVEIDEKAPDTLDTGGKAVRWALKKAPEFVGITGYINTDE